jgi:DNA-binding NtrC family response regulator
LDATAPEEPIHVLVLDTDENVFNIIQKLSNDNYITHWAQNLDEALLILEAQKIAILISDVQLAGEDITASIKVLKEYRANILTVILSSFQDTKTLIGLINQGQIYRFLPKPVHENLLAKSLTAAIRRYQTLKAEPGLSACQSVEKLPEEVKAKSSSGVLSFISKIRGF